MALSFGQKAGWGLADMGINVFVVIKQLLVLAFLTQYLGVPVAIAGAMTSVVLVFDMITDPLVGYLSDRTHSRWGRRSPWIFAGAILLTIAVVLMFQVPEGMSWRYNLTWVTGFFVLASLGFTCVTIPYGAMAGEMTQIPAERSVMTAYRMGFAALGILIAGGAMPALAGDTRAGYAWAVLLVSPVMILAIWGMLWATRRAPRIETPSNLTFGAMIQIVLRNPAFVVLVLCYGVMTLAVGMITAGLPFAAQYLISDPGTTPLSGMVSAFGIMSLLFAAFVVGALISQVVWVVMSRLMGKVWALTLGLILYAALLIGLGQVLPTQQTVLVAGVFVLAGLANGSYQQIPWAMYPDLMDFTRNESGAVIEGAFSAFWLFGQKAANAVAPLVLSLILARAGWQEAIGEVVPQTPTALWALHKAVTWVPAVILILSVIVLLGVYRPALCRMQNRAGEGA